MMSRRFLGFLVVSGFAAAVNFASRFAFDVVVPYAVAIVLAYGVGMATAFALNRRWQCSMERSFRYWAWFPLSRHCWERQNQKV